MSVGMEVGIGGAVVSVALFDVCSGAELSMEVGVGAAVRAGSGVASESLTNASTVAEIPGGGAVGVGPLWQARQSRVATNRGMTERKSIREPLRNQDVGTCDSAQDTQVKTTWRHEAPTVLTVDHLLLWVRKRCRKSQYDWRVLLSQGLPKKHNTLEPNGTLKLPVNCSWYESLPYRSVLPRPLFRFASRR